MKKKMIFALLLAGMSFVAPNVADAQNGKFMSPPPGNSWATFTPMPDGMSDCTYCNFFGNCMTARCAG